MTISVFLDNNVWDLLFKHQLDLSIELPKPEFSLGITSEAEFEIAPLRDKQPDKWAFIQRTIKECSVTTDTYFGFYDDTYPADKQRVAGFDVGRWSSPEEEKLRAALHSRRTFDKSKTREQTGLHKNEADLSLAVRSANSVVLTLDKKRDPLTDASELGGMVVFLKDFDPSIQKLCDVVRATFTKPSPLAAAD